MDKHLGPYILKVKCIALSTVFYGVSISNSNPPGKNTRLNSQKRRILHIFCECLSNYKQFFTAFQCQVAFWIVVFSFQYKENLIRYHSNCSSNFFYLKKSQEIYLETKYTLTSKYEIRRTSLYFVAIEM